MFAHSSNQFFLGSMVIKMKFSESFVITYESGFFVNFCVLCVQYLFIRRYFIC
jgi:hypothetical protein